MIVHADLGKAEDQDDIIYNPKNLPLGWDGKPIPYWLYKLHGLNIDYKCQICGNQTYRGPKGSGSLPNKYSKIKSIFCDQIWLIT